MFFKIKEGNILGKFYMESDFQRILGEVKL